MLSLSTSQEKTRNKLFTFLIISTFFLNVADAAFSLYYISYLKVLEEANPIWATIIHTNPVLFFILKMSIVALGCTFLYKNIHRISSKIGTVLCFTAYLFIVLWFLKYSIL